jgi:hypothetical protein
MLCASSSFSLEHNPAALHRLDWQGSEAGVNVGATGNDSFINATPSFTGAVFAHGQL